MPVAPKVVILGGGFAGLETAFFLHHDLGGKVDLTLVCDRRTFLFKPNTIYVPFGADPAKLEIPLEKALRRAGTAFVEARATAIDADARRVHAAGREIEYDHLVVATGAGMRNAEVPGLVDHGITIWTPSGMLKLRDRYRQIVDGDAGARTRLLFALPANNRCAGPLYEIALMTDTWLRDRAARDRVEIGWATYEDSYIQAYGPRLNTVIEDEFALRDIRGERGFVLTGVEPGKAHFQNGEVREFDELVAFPPHEAREQWGGLPSDERGFVRVARESRRVQGIDRVFAVGDAADFPIKQAYLALLQADAAADHLAAEIAGRPAKLDFAPMSIYVIEELNKATFVQVPLAYTDDNAQPVDVDVDADQYRVGVSPAWRLGKKAVGTAVAWRFGGGRPFHSGIAWEAMDLGRKAFARLFSR